MAEGKAHMRRLIETDFIVDDPARWPGPAVMNRQLHSIGITSLLRVWLHISDGIQLYDMLRQKGWFVSSADGTPAPVDLDRKSVV